MEFDAILKLKQALDKSPPNKDWLDEQLFKSVSKSWGGRGQRERNQPKIVRADKFAQIILPFCNPKFNRSEATVRTVDSNHVLGGCYFEHFPIDVDELPELLDKLNSRALDDHHAEQALYTQIGEFPIYIPYEGKNRVTLFRNAKRPIQALINRTAYPEPSQLTLRQVNPFSDCYALELKLPCKEVISVYREQILSHDSDRIVVVLAFNESVKALEEYGVQWERPIFSLSAAIKKRMCKLILAHTFYTR